METTLETTALSGKDMHSDLGRELVDIKKVLEAQGCSKDEVTRAVLARVGGQPDAPAAVCAPEEQTAPPARWLKFLEETVGDQKSIDFLQEFFGYCLSGSMEYATCLVLEGPGFETSVLLEVLRKTVGEEYCAAIPFDRLGCPVCRAALHGKLLNVFQDIDPRCGDDGISYLKALLAGDPIYGKHTPESTPFEFTPCCKLVAVTGELPVDIPDQFFGLKRRLRPVSFNKRRNPEFYDLWLTSALIKELPAIQEWADAGLQRLEAQRAFTGSHDF